MAEPTQTFRAQRSPEYELGGPTIGQGQPEIQPTESEIFAATHPADRGPAQDILFGAAMSLPIARSSNVFRALRTMLTGGASASSTAQTQIAKPPPLAVRSTGRATRPSMQDWLKMKEVGEALTQFFETKGETHPEKIERRMRREHVIEFPAERIPGSTKLVLEEMQRTGQKPPPPVLRDEPAEVIDVSDIEAFSRAFDLRELPDQWYDRFGDDKAAALTFHLKRVLGLQKAEDTYSAPVDPRDQALQMAEMHKIEQDQIIHSLWMNLQDRWGREHDLYISTHGESGTPFPSRKAQQMVFEMHYRKILREQYGIPTLPTSQKALGELEEGYGAGPYEQYREHLERVYLSRMGETGDTVSKDRLIDAVWDAENQLPADETPRALGLNTQGLVDIIDRIYPDEDIVIGQPGLSLEEARQAEEKATDILKSAEESPAPSRVSPEVDSALEEHKATRWDQEGGRKQRTVDPDWIKKLNQTISGDSTNVRPEGFSTQKEYYVEKSLRLFKERNMLIELMNRLSQVWDNFKRQGKRVPGQKERNELLESNVKQMLEAMSDLLNEADPDKVQEYFDNRPPDDPDNIPF